MVIGSTLQFYSHGFRKFPEFILAKLISTVEGGFKYNLCQDFCMLINSGSVLAIYLLKRFSLQVFRARFDGSGFMTFWK